MKVVEETKHVGWIEMSDQKRKKIPAQVRGWKVNYNEITNKVIFFLKEIEVKLQTKKQCNIASQTAPVLCSFYSYSSDNLGPVNIIFYVYFLIIIPFRKIQLQRTITIKSLFILGRYWSTVDSEWQSHRSPFICTAKPRRPFDLC